MKIIDKAVWQIDRGVPAKEVVDHFKTVFSWLMEHDMLTDEGIEEYEDGIDDCASLNDELVNERGIAFLEKCYDDLLKRSANGIYGSDHERGLLDTLYAEYLKTD
jgi:hypothetical protein